MSKPQIRIITYTGYIVEYRYNLKRHYFEVTDQMCNYSLGEEVDVSSANFAHMAGDPACRMSKAWMWPEKATLTFDQLRTIVEDNHAQFGTPF